jgi:uncharacterized membrane protein YphA (DoxX/SURF4 family)
VAGALHSWLAVGAAVLITAPYWVSALNKALNFPAAVREAQTLNIPLPQLVMAGVVCLQAAASLCLILGVWVWLWIAALGTFTLAANYLAHGFWRYSGSDRDAKLNAFLANMGLIGGLILLGITATP